MISSTQTLAYVIDYKKLIQVAVETKPWSNES